MTSGCVQSARAGSGDFGDVVPGTGRLVSRSKRLPDAPKITPGLSGSPAVKPLSPPAPTGSQSRIVIAANLPRERTPTAPLSCCAPVTQYGKLSLIHI